MKVWGIVGWKNSGKTGLVERLVHEFSARGLTVSTVKRAHHGISLDHPGTDSDRHRQAGAAEVILASGPHWRLIHQGTHEHDPSLEDLLARLAPVDLVLVEGFKAGTHPKTEAHRPETGEPLLAPQDPAIRSVASTGQPETGGVPCFALGDTTAIADHIMRELGL